MEANENDYPINESDERQKPMLDILTDRAAWGNREKYLAALTEVPHAEPDEWDKIVPAP